MAIIISEKNGIPQRVPMPEGWSRPETGPMQFVQDDVTGHGENDWPGLFIRGANALLYARTFQQMLKWLEPEDWMSRGIINGFVELLESCHIDHFASSNVDKSQELPTEGNKP